MSNSALVSYTKISPNRNSPRKHSIDTISIHCVVGQASVERLGEIFAPVSREASCNYGIGYDGRVGMYCEEKDRSWCTSSSSNDNRAITIEVASDNYAPYAVNDKAYQALIELVADICKRNDIKELKWKADKSLIGQIDKQNMTVHRWFSNKSCPGNYLYERHGDIVNKVNSLLNGSPVPDPKPDPSTCPYQEPTRQLNKGKEGEDVKWVQWYLCKNGYNVSIDGKFGSDTDTKIRKFQGDQGLKVDGWVGNDTKARLKNPSNKKANPYKEPTSDIRKGGKGDGVKWIQWELVEAGYKINVDGSFGPATDNAVRDFQKKSGLKVDGWVGKDTRAKLKAN